MPNKIALITGASRGLGRASALHLARTGTHIIGTYNSAKNEAAEVAHEIEALGVKASMLPFNAESDDFTAFAADVAETIATTFGAKRLDHIVNNAGIGIHATFPETTAEQIDRLYRIHVRTPFLLTQALSPHLNDGGSVLFVSSGLARFTLPGYAAYASMKGAIEVLTRYAAKELGGRGIRVNCIAPGAIATDFAGGGVRDNPAIHGFVASMTALGRVGEADDIGGAVAVILSDGMAWTTGMRIEVSGGQGL